MALTYQIDAAARMVLITCLERLEGREWRTCLRALAADDRLVPGCRILVDARWVSVVESDVVVAILGGLTTWWAELAGHSWTILADEQSDVEGIARVVSVHAARIGVPMVTNPAPQAPGLVPRFQWPG
jgi:hypothetical protein